MTSQQHIETLLNVLRRHADSAYGPDLAKAFSDFADCSTTSMAVMAPGSPERQLESVVAAVNDLLAHIVADLYLEIGGVRVDAAEWVENLEPDDFGGESW